MKRFADAAEPPAAIPANVVAAAAHPALAMPAVERDEVPIPIGIFPTGAVWVIIGKEQIVFVDFRLGPGIELESADFVLFFQIFVADMAVANVSESIYCKMYYAFMIA